MNYQIMYIVLSYAVNCLKFDFVVSVFNSHKELRTSNDLATNLYQYQPFQTNRQFLEQKIIKQFYSYIPIYYCTLL
jgi:hypothetical protein